MAIPAIDFIPAAANLEQIAFGNTQGAAQPTQSFETWMQSQIGELNHTLGKGDALAARLAAGETENLHQIMIGMEETKLAFQLAVQVRNRVLEAYQDILRMQI